MYGVTPYEGAMGGTFQIYVRKKGVVFLLDTVRLLSPDLDKKMTDKINNKLNTIMEVEKKTGEILWEFTREKLKGSYDNRIYICLENEVYKWDKKENKTHKFDSKPHLKLEASIHKLMLGHNIKCGPDRILPSIKWFIKKISELLEVNLPPAGKWKVHRIDWAECFKLGDKKIKDWFYSLRNCYYGRRKVKYYNDGVHISGSTTTLKFYHKGNEFRKHDRGRFRKIFGEENFFNMLNQANQILRVEVGIHKRKLKYDFDHVPIVTEIKESYLKKLWDKEINKFIKENESEMKIVYEPLAVRERLYNQHRNTLAKALYKFWMEVNTLGYKKVKEFTPKRTFIRNKKYLKEDGISIRGGENEKEQKKEGQKFIDFYPSRKSSYLIDKKCFAVRRIERKYSSKSKNKSINF